MRLELKPHAKHLLCTPIIIDIDKRCIGFKDEIIIHKKNPKLLLVKGFRSGPTRARTLDPLIMSQVL